MMGQREILTLRAQLEERDGDRFDHQAFHDQVIGHGSLPLDVLREHLPVGWSPADVAAGLEPRGGRPARR